MSRSAASTSARAADHNLASEQFPELNREFYDANPADYVHRRLRGLIISISDSPAIHDALVQGVSYGTTEIRRGTEHEDDQAATEAYASLESTNLLHLAGECMLRLYLAHADHQACPWLEIARLRSPQAFKSRVSKLRESLGEQETIDDLVRIFLGNTQPEPLGLRVTTEEWQRQIDGLVMLVAHVCNTLLGDATLYNATKHGLAVVGGNSGLSLSAPSGDLTIATDGPGLTYLDLTAPDAPDGRRWTKTLTFVQIESNLGLVEIIGLYIRSLWMIAKYRYTGAADEMPILPGIEPQFLRQIIEYGRGEGPFGFAGMAQTLLYYVDDEPDDGA